MLYDYFARPQPLVPGRPVQPLRRPLVGLFVQHFRRRVLPLRMSLLEIHSWRLLEGLWAHLSRIPLVRQVTGMLSQLHSCTYWASSCIAAAISPLAEGLAASEYPSSSGG